jgi:hypothetical protein
MTDNKKITLAIGLLMAIVLVSVGWPVKPVIQPEPVIKEVPVVISPAMSDGYVLDSISGMVIVMDHAMCKVRNHVTILNGCLVAERCPGFLSEKSKKPKTRLCGI